MAGRPRSIDRDKVLDAAETLISSTGAGALSFESVAKAAGITKGGVQYAFGTRDKLIRAMIARWNETFDAEVARRTGPDPTPAETLRAIVEETRDGDIEDQSRIAVFMATALQHPDQIAEFRDWYRAKLEPLDLTKSGDRKAALAFMASEAAFLLSAFGLVHFEDRDWAALFDDILSEPALSKQSTANQSD
ncbi:TetR/AcrR family transcriptional regulator [Sagittula stellata]|uniref:Putative transcriptional regulator n=1 Tax=Sagittula stellata (strain ATCC 700073 / DSM 11524 / E-37) TaxID=388399 RepID=A3K7R4_SAGS3|nr:TetR/AcrR family transcriptional regulator [Sagittula stellata]EBA06686.1 putative transcriptional regulator [Sagittula stellata E-37]